MFNVNDSHLLINCFVSNQILKTLIFNILSIKLMLIIYRLFWRSSVLVPGCWRTRLVSWSWWSGSSLLSCSAPRAAPRLRSQMINTSVASQDQSEIIIIININKIPLIQIIMHMLFQYLFIHYLFMTVFLKTIIILMSIIMSIIIIYLLTWHTLESPSAMLHIIAGVNWPL